MFSDFVSFRLHFAKFIQASLNLHENFMVDVRTWSNMASVHLGDISVNAPSLEGTPDRMLSNYWLTATGELVAQ